MTRRVVITGIGDVTAFGEGWQAVSARLLVYESAVRKVSEWQVCDGLYTLLRAPIDDFILPEHYTCKWIRATERILLMSIYVIELALEQVGLIGDRILTSGGTGAAYGSSTSSTGPVSELMTMLTEKHTNNTIDATYVQMVLYTTVANTGLFFGLRGRVTPASSACISGSQIIDYVRGATRHGYQTMMVAGGVGELYSSEAAVFDMLFATSQCNSELRTTPSPFDEKRDGLITGGDVSALVLEELEHARAHGIMIHGEIISLATNCDAAHIIQPQRETMQICMEKSLNVVGISARDIGYVSAHGTVIGRGDVTEGRITPVVCGDNVPLSLLKSYFGHALGARGALETWMSL